LIWKVSDLKWKVSYLVWKVSDVIWKVSCLVWKVSLLNWKWYIQGKNMSLYLNKYGGCIVKIKSYELQVDDGLIKELLTAFTASCSEQDALVLDILRMCERTFACDLRKFSPLVWGDMAGSKYDDLKKLGATLYDRPTADQVLALLDGKKVG
jgi:hypothetical protein